MLRESTLKETEKEEQVNIFSTRVNKTSLSYDNLNSLLPIIIDNPKKTVELVPKTISEEIERAFDGVSTLKKY